MAVTRAEEQVVLLRQGRDPQVIGRDRRALLAELSEHLRVVASRLFIRIQHANSRTIQETNEHLFVLPGPHTAEETRAKFGERHKRQIDPICGLEAFDDLRHADTEISVAVGIDGNSHVSSSPPEISVNLVHLPDGLVESGILDPRAGKIV